MSVQTLQKVTRKLAKTASKNSQTILVVLGVGLLVVTVVSAADAGAEASEILKEEKRKRGTNDPILFKDKVKLTWKCYVRTGVLGALTAGCMVGSNSINLRKNAALAGAYSLSEATLKEYKAKVVETIGEKKEKAIKDEIAKDRVQKNPVSNKEVILTGNGETLCYDSLSGRYFKSDIESIRATLNDLSRDLMNEQTISLNQVYDALGLAQTKMGDILIWHIDDGLIDPCFSSQLTANGVPCLVLDFDTQPRYVPYD